MEKKRQNPLIIAAKAVMLALTAVYPLFMVCMSGAGLIYNKDSYGSASRGGICRIFCRWCARSEGWLCACL